MTQPGDFDFKGLWQAIESVRRARGLTPGQLVRDIAWLSAGVINRLEQGHPTSCQHATGLLRWLGRSPESFVPGVVDRPEYAIPDDGPYAVRWSMPALWEAIDTHRESQDLSWAVVAGELQWPKVKTCNGSVSTHEVNG